MYQLINKQAFVYSKYLKHFPACCSSNRSNHPLQEMLEFHAGKEGAVATILGTEATRCPPPPQPLPSKQSPSTTSITTTTPRQQSVNYGCVVEDKVSHAVLHYVEKPSSYIRSCTCTQGCQRGRYTDLLHLIGIFDWLVACTPILNPFFVVKFS